MADCDPEREREFYEVFRDYYDFEADANRRPSRQHYSLDRMVPLAAAAGNPERKLDFVHVAGTKGKGSTCAFLASFLAAAGESCGLYASPHLYSVRERFQMGGKPVEYDTLLPAARDFEKRVRSANLTPGLFELLTVFALRLFADHRCRWCVLETGIGGVLDATNYIPAPRCAVITPISLDHCELLGDTVEQIALQKAGIIKPHTPVVCADQPFPEAEAVIRRRAREVHAGFHAVSRSSDPTRWRVAPAPPFTLDNFHLARTVCDVLDIRSDPDAFVPPVLHGRFQVLRDEPPVVVDAAHNADSVRRLAEALAAVYPERRFTIVLGVVRGKDVDGIAREFAAVSADFILTDPRAPKESALDQMAEAFQATDLPARTVRDIQSRDDLGEAQEGPLLFTGSFFTALIGCEVFAQREEIVEKTQQSGLRSEFPRL